MDICTTRHQTDVHFWITAFLQIYSTCSYTLHTPISAGNYVFSKTNLYSHTPCIPHGTGGHPYLHEIMFSVKQICTATPLVYHTELVAIHICTHICTKLCFQ